MNPISISQPSHIDEVLMALSSGGHRAGTLNTTVLKDIIDLLPRRDIFSVETGCGRSTIAFSNIARHHISFCYDDRDMPDSSVSYVLGHRHFVANRTSFVFGPTQFTLPQHTFSDERLFDLVLIDGPHGYPFPDLEYWHLYPRLAPGGLLIVDDLMIPSIGRMYDILREDRMFDEVAVFATTGVLRRTHEPALPRDGDHWWIQAHNFRQFPTPMQSYRRDFTYAFGTRLDFSQKAVADQYSVRGFQSRPGDGAVSIDTSALIRVKCDAQTATHLSMKLSFQVTSLPDVTGGSIHVNDVPVVEIPTDAREVDVAFTCPVAPDGDYRIEFRMPVAKAIHDTRGNFNFRRGGLTLRQFVARPAQEANAAPTIRVVSAPDQSAVSTPAPLAMPAANGGLNAEDFAATLSRLCDLAAIEEPESARLAEVMPPPILCPHIMSPVRFLPMRGVKTSPVPAGVINMLPLDGKAWQFEDFFAFEGEDFAYAVVRSLLHRPPNKRQMLIGTNGDLTDMLLLVLDADYRARKEGGLGKFVDLPATRMLYRLYRALRRHKLPAPESVLRRLVGKAAKSAHEASRHRIEERRLLLRTIGPRSRKERAS